MDLLEVSIYLFPVDDVPESIYEFTSLVLVIQIVGMLPYVYSHKDGEIRESIDIMLFYLHDPQPFGVIAEGECSPA